ncbi:MAG: hypothetical protein OXG53_05360 [Chloroflexi bacterium]|nr:hypothetical protein [Chloroflexota bacterium]
MKKKHSGEGQSGCWAKLMSALVAVGIVVLLVFGGVLSILSQITELQQDLDGKTAEFQNVSDQLAAASGELVELRSELAERAAKLEMASIVVTESHIELYAFNWAQQIAACVLNESRVLSDYLMGENGQASSVESARYSDYQAFIVDQKEGASPLRQYCIQYGIDKTMLDVWWESAFARTAGEIDWEETEAVEFLQSFGGILVPHSTVVMYTDQILANMSSFVGEWHPDISGQVVSRLWFDR